MSSSSGTSMVTLAAPTYHHHLRQTSLVKPVTSSTIYHSPQSSPPNDQSTPTPPPLSLTSNSSSSTLMLTNNNNEDDRIESMDDHDDEDEEKPLDFSSKSSSPPPPLTGSKGTSDIRKLLDQQELPRAKKIHQKYLANKQQQQTAAEHCFTTPSPSPPEHRISSSSTNNNQISMAKITDESRYVFEEMSHSNIAKNNPNDNDGILSKLFQGLSHIQHEQNVCPTPKTNTLPQDSLINETLLNQALQFAKLQQQQPIVDLINLLTQAHQQPIQNSLKLIANHPQTTPFPMMPVSPMKPILTSPPRSLSPSTFPGTTTQQQHNQPSPPTSAKGHNHAAFISNGTTGGLLTAASTNITNTTASESAFLGSLMNRNDHRTSPPLSSSNLLSTLPKYTRPFKALYSKTDHSLASMLNHQQQQHPISPQSTSPQSSTAGITHNVASTTTFPPLESLTAQSILNSSQAYKMFRSRMLSPSTSPLIGTKHRNTRLSANGGKTQNKNNNTRSFSFQLKSENSDDTSSSDSSFNATTAFLDNSSQSPINHNHVNGQTILLEQTNNNSQKSTISTNNKNGNSIVPIVKSSGLTSPSLASTVPTTVGNGGRKRGRPLPDDLKDEAYWERRRKNNEAAKRSRDLRRAKEDEIAIRACFLEQENRQLKCELIQVKLELDKMKTLLATLQSSQPVT